MTEPTYDPLTPAQEALLEEIEQGPIRVTGLDSPRARDALYLTNTNLVGNRVVHHTQDAENWVFEFFRTKRPR